jgi:hypothetical protein
MSKLEKLRHYFNEWQSQGYEERPVWYDVVIDDRINALTNVELLDLLEQLEDYNP